jgi:anthranilate synthase/aminodeoxychorismate synthase-like glutamine amidotransferase
MLLLFDNYDSFTWNLNDYLQQCGSSCRVIRNDECSMEEILSMQPNGIVMSPGPGIPSTSGLLMPLIEHFHDKKPMLGICLGYQALGEFFGATLLKSPVPFHGKTSMIEHTHHPMFTAVPSPLQVMRYHSLMLSGLEKTPFEITSRTATNEPMSLAHTELPLWGMQFHPESILTECGLRLIQNWIDFHKLAD